MEFIGSREQGKAAGYTNLEMLSKASWNSMYFMQNLRSYHKMKYHHFKSRVAKALYMMGNHDSVILSVSNAYDMQISSAACICTNKANKAPVKACQTPLK